MPDSLETAQRRVRMIGGRNQRADVLHYGCSGDLQRGTMLKIQDCRVRKTGVLRGWRETSRSVAWTLRDSPPVPPVRSRPLTRCFPSSLLAADVTPRVSRSTRRTPAPYRPRSRCGTGADSMVEMKVVRPLVPKEPTPVVTQTHTHKTPFSPSPR